MEDSDTVTINSIAIWTVGHSTRSIEEFIVILQANQIEILVDVRHFPGSRKFPHFNKGALHDALVTAGIRYESANAPKLDVGQGCINAHMLSVHHSRLPPFNWVPLQRKESPYDGAQGIDR